MKKQLFTVLLLIAISLFGVKALFHSGFYSSHDGEHQVIRLYQYSTALVNGQLPPRWAGSLFNGYGYPLFFFNYPLPWIISSPFYLSGISLTDSIKIAFILGFIFSGITMYFLQKQLFKNNLGAFVGSFLYLWAPYRFSNVFVRANLGEATTYVFIPLIFWAFFRLQGGMYWPAIIIGAIGIAGVLLSHLMIFILFLIPVFILVLAQVLKSKKRVKYLLSIVLLGVLGAGLSAYYTIPAVIYQNLTKFKDVIPLFYQNHFVTLGQLLYSKWDYGFSDGIRSNMSFQIGIAQWAVIIISTLLCLVGIIKKGLIKNFSLAIPLLIIFWLSVFLMTAPSHFIWKMFEKVISIDYPWRFLSVSVFSSSLLAGWLMTQLPEVVHTLKSRISIKAVSVFLAAIILCVAFYTNRNHLRVNEYFYYGDKFYIENSKTTNSYEEYAPKWVSSEIVKNKAVSPLEYKTGNVNLVEFNPYKRVQFTTSGGQTEVKVNIVYFPGWMAFIDAKETVIDYKGNGLININVPKGNHKIVVEFGEDNLMRLADMVTLFTIIILPFGIFLTRVKKIPYRLTR